MSLRFKKQDLTGLAGGKREWWQARHGALRFDVERRSKTYKYWPGGGVQATIMLGFSDPPSFRYKAKDVASAKQWCRGALTYILRGTVPFTNDG